MAALTVAAIVAQLVRSVSSAIDAGRDVATIVSNFFSFFTILSNTAAAVVLLWTALWFWTRGREADAEPRGLATALAAVTTYMVITGIVYNLLLRGVALEPGAVVGWSNEVLHLVGPLFLLADLFVGPRRRALPWRSLWWIVAFPLVWVAYTMVRGPLITNPGTGDPFWYPYPFLNPNNDGGWTSVILYVIGIAIAILAVASFVLWWGRRTAERAVVDPVPQTADTL
ncbi:Pr6Pr family membrane protein [Microbacterium sp. NEAU-LLC]|uniref:Pr6Pr family membrane protein n=2 Tax=Microbacterium helvum TaxID=2773713 RepID=A0ABR8NN07_9MICO|nr:Pr6Pr family membrane protein [Microbacterium helvum]